MIYALYKITGKMASNFYLTFNSIDNDYEICDKLEIKYDYYLETLVKKFNGIFYQSKIYFQNMQDVQAAIKWLESYEVMYELRYNNAINKN